MKHSIPLLQDLSQYDVAKFKGDLLSGMTVGVMLVPQSMAYAMIAGLPPVYGLYAAIFPQLLYAFLGTSRQLAVGPVAMDSIIIAAGLSTIAAINSEEYISLAIILALMVGVIQLALGIVRLGFIVNFLSKPVIQGFTYAAALVISINQFKHVFGIQIDGVEFTHEILVIVVQKFGEVNWIAFAIGCSGILTIWLTKRLNPLLPAALISVIGGTVLVAMLDLDQRNVDIFGDIPGGLPSFQLPLISTDRITQLLPVAFTLAVIGFMEAFSLAKAIEGKHRNEYKIKANSELIALGSGNIFGSFFSAFPTSGGFSRTAVNESSGAKTGMASIFAATLVVITVLFLTPLFYYVPTSVLSAVIITAVLGLIDRNQIRYLWNCDRTDFYMMAATFAGTLIIGIREGIIIGVTLSLGMLIFRTTRPHIAVLGKIPGTTIYKNILRFKEAEEPEKGVVVRVDSRIYFANVNFIKDKIFESLGRRGAGLNFLIIDAQSISAIDSTGMEAIMEIWVTCLEQNISLGFASVIGPVRDTFVRHNFIDQLGRENCFENVHEAIESFEGGHGNSKTSSVSFQSNL